MNCVHGTVARPGPSSVYRYSTVQYSTVQYSTVQYRSTALCTASPRAARSWCGTARPPPARARRPRSIPASDWSTDHGILTADWLQAAPGCDYSTELPLPDTADPPTATPLARRLVNSFGPGSALYLEIRIGSREISRKFYNMWRRCLLAPIRAFSNLKMPTSASLSHSIKYLLRRLEAIFTLYA